MPTLGETGQILVTQRATDAYLDHHSAYSERRLGYEEARRQLTILLAGATRGQDTESGAERWRARSRPLDVDVSALVTREPGLAVVVHVHVRRYVTSGGGRGARERRAQRGGRRE